MIRHRSPPPPPRRTSTWTRRRSSIAWSERCSTRTKVPTAPIPVPSSPTTSRPARAPLGQPGQAGRHAEREKARAGLPTRDSSTAARGEREPDPGRHQHDVHVAPGADLRQTPTERAAARGRCRLRRWRPIPRWRGRAPRVPGKATAIIRARRDHRRCPDALDDPGRPRSEDLRERPRRAVTRPRAHTCRPRRSGAARSATRPAVSRKAPSPMLIELRIRVRRRSRHPGRRHGSPSRAALEGRERNQLVPSEAVAAYGGRRSRRLRFGLVNELGQTLAYSLFIRP